MPLKIPVPPSTAAFEDRGAVLRVTGVPGGPLELRVDDGLVFARFLSTQPEGWAIVDLSSVLGFFAANSPVSTFLRQQGVFPLRQQLLDSLTGRNEPNAEIP